MEENIAFLFNFFLGFKKKNLTTVFLKQEKTYYRLVHKALCL